MNAPCRHCLDADASPETGLCVPCERDEALAAPVEWPLLGARTVMLVERACGVERELELAR